MRALGRRAEAAHDVLAPRNCCYCGDSTVGAPAGRRGRSDPGPGLTQGGPGAGHDVLRRAAPVGAFGIEFCETPWPRPAVSLGGERAARLTRCPGS